MISLRCHGTTTRSMLSTYRQETGGADELELDLDHLLEGLPAGGMFRFRIMPTRLRFYE
jgi:hypothetical protein